MGSVEPDASAAPFSIVPWLHGYWLSLFSDLLHSSAVSLLLIPGTAVSIGGAYIHVHKIALQTLLFSPPKLSKVVVSVALRAIRTGALTSGTSTQPLETI